MIETTEKIKFMATVTWMLIGIAVLFETTDRDMSQVYIFAWLVGLIVIAMLPEKKFKSVR